MAASASERNHVLVAVLTLQECNVPIFPVEPSQVLTAFLTESSALSGLARAEAACKRCPLYKDATQVVPGEGPAGADFMLVGEQPGDKEDLAGRPFVGPAGRILDAALKDAGIDRKHVFVTNAVKHFKHEMRGKKRLHKRPSSYRLTAAELGLPRSWKRSDPR